MLCMAKKAEQVGGGRPWREVRQEQGHLRPSVPEEGQKKGLVPTLETGWKEGVGQGTVAAKFLQQRPLESRANGGGQLGGQVTAHQG